MHDIRNAPIQLNMTEPAQLDMHQTWSNMLSLGIARKVLNYVQIGTILVGSVQNQEGQETFQRG